MGKNENEPHAKRRGRLRNGNPSGDPSKAPRCGAKTRRSTKCLAPAMKNGRCRLHGGKSTGPRTQAGLEKSRRAAWKHGGYSIEMKRVQKESREMISEVQDVLRMLRKQSW